MAAQHGCDLSQFTAKQVTATLVEQADYVFVMTRGHKQMLERALPQCSDKTFLLSHWYRNIGIIAGLRIIGTEILIPITVIRTTSKKN